MNIKDATTKARQEAVSGRVKMVVTYAPYDEAKDECERYGYMTSKMFKVVALYQKIVLTISKSGQTVF